MARGITKEQVFMACEKVWASGKPVTSINVRKVYNTGSFSTYEKYIKEWKEQTDKDLVESDIPIPEEVHTILKDCSQRLYKRAFIEADMQCNDEKVKTLERENEDLRDEIERLKGEETKVKLLEKQCKQIKEEKDEEVRSNGRLRESVSHLEQIVQKLATKEK